jgi:hypothetical protein
MIINQGQDVFQHTLALNHHRPQEGLMAEVKLCKIEGCGNASYLKGLCNAHYLRLRRHGSPLGGGTGKGAPLSWLKASIKNQTDDCVDWPFAKNGNGYGWAHYAGKRIGAHRLALVLKTGIDPSGFDAAHSCNNRKCVNPMHLRWAGRSENALDRHIHGTMKTKISEADVQMIRTCSKSAKVLAKELCVSESLIYKIRSYRVWK